MSIVLLESAIHLNILNGLRCYILLVMMGAYKQQPYPCPTECFSFQYSARFSTYRDLRLSMRNHIGWPCFIKLSRYLITDSRLNKTTVLDGRCSNIYW